MVNEEHKVNSVLDRKTYHTSARQFPHSFSTFEMDVRVFSGTNSNPVRGVLIPIIQLNCKLK